MYLCKMIFEMIDYTQMRSFELQEEVKFVYNGYENSSLYTNENIL